MKQPIRSAKPAQILKNTLLKATAYQKKVAISMGIALLTSGAYADISQAQVQHYANTMNSAANSKNIGQVARLLSDDVVIVMTRSGKGTVTLDKNGYLDLLQKGWTQSKNYHYSITMNDIVITGDTARADITTLESWEDKEGKKTNLTTSSRATLGLSGKNTVLLRSVSQVSVE